LVKISHEEKKADEEKGRLIAFDIFGPGALRKKFQG
jgi:hypothetical protein